MTIALPIPAVSGFASYDDLVATIEDWLKDTTLSAQVDTFLAITEARFNRLLITTDMEYTQTSAGAAEITLLPDYRGMRSIYVDASPRRVLTYLSPDDFRRKWTGEETGTPENYTIENNTLLIAPVSSDDIVVNYTRALTPLTADSVSNWVLEYNPDAYLAGCLCAAELRGWNDERLPLLKSWWDEIIAEMNQANIRRRHGEDIATVQADYF